MFKEIKPVGGNNNTAGITQLSIAKKIINLNPDEARALIEKIDKALEGEDASLAVCIRWSIKSGLSPLVIIDEVKEMIGNNYSMMSKLLGRRLAKAVIKF